MELRKFIATTIREYLNEQQSYNSVWYHGTPNETLNFNIYSKGNQIPYGVHFTQNKDIAIDFAKGSTKLKKTEKANLFICDINTDNSFDISEKHIFTEGDLYFNILNEIGIKSKIEYIIHPTKNGQFYHPKYLGQDGFVNKIDAETILDNAKPNAVIQILNKYKIKPIIKYKMVGSTDILGYNKIYTDAICVLESSYVKILSIEALS
jgi:hypothetical protein